MPTFASTNSVNLRPIPWNNVVNSDVNCQVNNGYFITNTGAQNAYLPQVCNVGDIIILLNLSSGQTVSIFPYASQYIYFGANVTTAATGTPSTTGSLTTATIGDAIELVCYIQNTAWVVKSAVGGIYNAV